MFYHLAVAYPTFHAFNIITYISTRTVCAFLTSSLISLVLGGHFINALKKRYRARVSNRPPERHLMKNNTATMGGIVIIGVVTLTTLLWGNLTDPFSWILIACLWFFGAIGLADDLIKMRDGDGMRAVMKFLLQTLGAGVLATGWYLTTPTTLVCVPFFKWFMPELGLLAIPWAMFIMVGTSNSVNLTDGLDGLATGPLITSFTTYGVIAYLAGNLTTASYLYLPFAGTGETTVVCGALLGSLLGFLWYNAYPAEVFMGDVGSLPLGACLGLLAVMTRNELLLVLVGGVFVVETVSVILQIASMRFRDRRLFRMAPIHHHFELRGWHEVKITTRVWIISLLLAALSLLTLKIR